MASLCPLASGAFAADVSIQGSLNETLQGSDNYFLRPAPSGSTFQSLSAVNLDFLARTPTTRYLLNTNFSYYNYFGAGASDTSPTQGTPASTTFSINHDTEITKYNFATSWHRVDVAATQLTESGFATAHGLQDTYNVGGGFTHDLNRTDAISLSALATASSFTKSDQTSYADYTTTAAWTHRFTPTTKLVTSVTFDWFDAADPSKTERLLWTILTGVQTQLSGRLTFNASVGESFANSYQRNPGAPNPSGSTSFQYGAANGVVGNAGLTYQLLKTTRVSLTAAESYTPTTLGQLQKISTIGLLLNHDINGASNLSFSTQFSHSKFAFTESDFFSAQVSYGYRLTREWRTSLSYLYRQRFNVSGSQPIGSVSGSQPIDNFGSAQSSTVLFSLAYDFTLLGNPTANGQKQVDNEREILRDNLRPLQVFPTLN